MLVASGFVHLEGDKVDSSTLITGSSVKWQLTHCGRVAAKDSLLTLNPRKVTCPACQKRIEKESSNG